MADGQPLLVRVGGEQGEERLRIVRGEQPVGHECCRAPRGRTSAIFATGMPCADSSTIWARRQVTTEPVPCR